MKGRGKAMRWGSGVAVALSLTACMGGGRGRAVQVYDGAPDDSAVILVGDVASIDGRAMPPRSRTFELLPGCHAITNITYWIGNDVNAAMTVRLPEMSYMMDMKPGHNYELRIGTTANADTARVVVKALERNADGDVTRTFDPGQPCATP